MRSGVKHRAGLVGAGYICEYHIAALRRLKEAVEIVGVFDVDGSKARAVSERFGIPAHASMEALRDSGATVLHVLTPPHTHAAVTLKALDLGCHVLIEKPMAEDAGDCQKIGEAAARKNLQVCVNHSLLFDPQVRRALQVVRSGKLGKVVSVDILRSSTYPPYAGGPLPPQYRTGGYPFRDLGVHALYLMEAFLGPIGQVSAEWASLGGDPNLAYDEWRAQVRCRDGLGQFQLSWNVKPLQSQIVIQGTAGVLRVDLFLMFKALRASTPLPKSAERIVNALTDSLQPLVDVPRGVYGFLRKKILPYHGLQELIRAFYDALAHGQPVPVSVAEAERVVRWTEQVARAADAEHAGRVAGLPPLSPQVPYLVTGASGGLGSEIVRRLRAAGHRVRVLVRRPPAKVEDGMEVALGDLGDPDAVDRAVRGAEIVIHAGAAMKGSWPEHERGTVVGTRNVLEACIRNDVKKLVHVSSLSVVDWAGAGLNDPIRESSKLEPRPEDRGSYTRAKLESERLVSQYVRERHLPAVILRPGQIFGRRIPLLTAAVARRLGRRWLILGDGKCNLPLVHIDDVVDAIVRVAVGDLHQGEIIQLVDPDVLTQREVLKLAAGPNARTLRIPRPFLFAMGTLTEVPLGIMGRKSPLSRYRLRSALSKRRFAAENMHLLDGWKPAMDLRERIRQVAEEQQHQGGAPVR